MHCPCLGAQTAEQAPVHNLSSRSPAVHGMAPTSEVCRHATEAHRQHPQTNTCAARASVSPGCNCHARLLFSCKTPGQHCLHIPHVMAVCRHAAEAHTHHPPQHHAGHQRRHRPVPGLHRPPKHRGHGRGGVQRLHARVSGRLPCPVPGTPFVLTLQASSSAMADEEGTQREGGAACPLWASAWGARLQWRIARVAEPGCFGPGLEALS